MNSTKKKAFTLAEVLITIGVIGVVAAITIPTLMSQYQENANRSKLKNVYSIISEATKQIQLDTNNDIPWCFATCDVQMKDTYKGYLKAQDNGLLTLTGIYKMYKGDYHPNTNPPSLRMSDGSILGFLSWGAFITNVKGLTATGLIYVDVQGGHGPKMLGVDTFVFELQKDNNNQLFVYPIGIPGDGTSCQITTGVNYANCPLSYGCTYSFLNGSTLP